MKRRSLIRKIIESCIIFGVAMVLIAGFVVGKELWNASMESYREEAYMMTRAAAAYIDSEKIIEYTETLKKDDYYENVQKYLVSLRKNSDVEYFYVFVPYEDDIMYIWDADADVTCDLGYREPYMENGKDTLLSVFKKDPEEKLSLERDKTYGFIGSAYSPVFDKTGEPVALVGLDLSMPDVHRTIRGLLLALVLSIAAVTLAGSFFLYSRMKNNLIDPIQELAEAAQEMVKHIEDEVPFEFKPRANDEIQDLSDAFVTMDTELKQYIRELSSVTEEKEKIRAELNIAANIQAAMLPQDFPNTREYEIYASMDPAKEVGGDFYDFFMVDESHLAFVIADVSGKGIAAALFMVIAKTLIKDSTTQGRDLGQVFETVNNLLCGSNRMGMFVTAFEAVLDLKTGEMQYVNAGHEPPFIRKKDGTFVMHRFKPQLVLAVMEDMTYQSGTLMLEPGDRIFQYTDGVTEATNSDNILYELERLDKALNLYSWMTPKELLNAVTDDINTFVGDAPQFDDTTMICVDFKEKME